MPDDPYNRQNKPAALGLVSVVLLLTAWFVGYVPWYERQQPVTETEQAEIDTQMQQNMEDMQSLITMQLDLSQMAIERERENDATGQALSTRCIQWTDLHESRPTDNTLKNQEYACRRFTHYVTTGEVLPEPEDDP